MLIEPSEVNKINGPRPQKGDKVSVHYSGRFDHDGEEFDSSHKRARPFTFEINANRVIKCWDEGLSQLSKGMKARLLCPPEYAYGSSGAGRIIPPDASLLFDVELVDINPVSEAAQNKQNKDDVSRSQRRNSKRKSWRDLPPEGDERTHICLEPIYYYGAVATLVCSTMYLVYACMMPDQTMTLTERKKSKIEAKKKSKKISENKIE